MSRNAVRVELGDWDVLGGPARAIRERVFVVEQCVPRELEWDEFDAGSRHALARTADGCCVGTGRLLPDGHIGRMAVLPEWRRQGVGAALLQTLMEEACRLGHGSVRLHAQIQAVGFYARYGFVAEGGEYLEAGIRHVTMARTLAPRNGS